MNGITKISNHMEVKLFTKLLSLTVLWLVLASFIGAEQAQAKLTLNPDPGPIPVWIRDALENCDNQRIETPGFGAWVAQAGSPATTVLNVPYGQASIDLEFHMAAVVCFYGQKATDTSHKIESAGPVGVTGAAGKELFLQYTINPPPGQYRQGTIGFKYAPPGGFTTSGDHFITLTSRGINRFSNGKFRCTAPPGTYVSHLRDYGPCPLGPSVFLIRVNVGPPPPPPPLLSCAGITPGDIEPGGPPFGMTVRFRNQAGHAVLSGASLKFTVGTSPAQSFSAVPYNPNPLPGGSTATSDSRLINTPPPGSYAVTLEVTGGNSPGGTLTCPDLLVRSKPYFRVYGGDVLAGLSGFDACTPTSGSRIMGYNDGAGAGAATQLAAQAMGVITGFSSSTGRDPGGALARPPTGLTFANSGSVSPSPPDNMGGNFGSMPCNKNYFVDTGDPITGSSFNPSLAVNGVYKKSGPLELVGSGGGFGLELDPGAKKVIFVDGDLSIKRDIKYSLSGSWSSPNDIPQFWVIVKGNIYIQPNVTQLDGVYIAQPNGTSGGNIYTCANGFSRPAFGGSFYGDCQNKLTVNGTFIAQQINLLRTVGTMRNSDNGEVTSSGNIAEVFNFSPEVWMGSPVLPDPSGGKFDYDAITSLPPVL